MKFPFKTEILLITSSGDFIGTIVHGGNDILQVSNVSRRTYTVGGTPVNTYVTDLMIMNRHNVLGYSKLENVNSKIKYKILDGTNNVYKLRGDDNHEQC